MNKINWMSTIAINLTVLRCVGLWPGYNKPYTTLYKFYAVFNAVALIGLQNLTQIINIFFIYKDLEALTGTFFILSTNLLAAAKMCIFARNLQSVRQLFKSLNSEQFQPKSQQQRDIICPSLRRWKVSYIVYVTLVFTNLVMWVTAPYLVKGLPFLAWYPFDVERSPNYALVYAYQTIFFLYLTAANINLDTFVFALLMYIWTQCDMLCDDLSNLDWNLEEFGKKLLECIEHHKAIINFAKKSNSVFNLIILGQFATSTMTLALTMFQLSLTESVNVNILSPVFYVGGLFCQLFLYCSFGSEIELKSSRIPYAMYKSKWFDCPHEVKRSLLILGERCQNPIQITAIGLFDLSLRTFVNILRTAWSYFAVLYNVNNR